MKFLTFSPDEVITSYAMIGDNQKSGMRRVGRASAPGGIFLASDSHTEIPLKDQFIVFQFNHQLEGPTVLEASQVEPKIIGSADEPDVLVSLEMLSFHTGAKEPIEPDTRATMRINFGKDQSSTDKQFDTLYWSIAAGLQLYDSAKNMPSESKHLNGDFRKAFGNRPIEIPGGLGRVSFQVVKHREPKWWKKLFGFAQSETAKKLVSVLGFPAITTQAIALIDELIDRLDNESPEVLFSSIPMRLSLSQWARDEFTGGNPRIRIGSLRQGFCVLARGRDYDAFANSNALYYPHYGKLVPSDIGESDLVSGKYDDPFNNLTYAVFRIGMKGTKIDPSFNFSA